VTVIERAPALTEVGAGLQISPNGARVLIALGLGKALAALSVRSRAVQLCDGLTGRDVLRLDLPQAEENPGFHLLHRADLIALLAQGAADAGVTVRLGTEVMQASLGPKGARLDLSGGGALFPDFTIGADGLKSRLHAALNGVVKPLFTGQVAWRATIPEGQDTVPEARVFMGPGRHLVSYPLRGGALRNIVAVEEREGWVAEGWSLRDDPAALRTAFRDFAGQVPNWLEGAEDVFLWGLFRHPVADRWWAPGVAILGDAAHPTLPFLAQGANMALEDAYVLAECIDRNGLADLSDYQEERRDRCIRIVAAATANARAYHLRWPVRAFAHRLLRLGGALAGRAALGRYDWLYDHDVTRGAWATVGEARAT
jgi:salicylate hydroxylase